VGERKRSGDMSDRKQIWLPIEYREFQDIPRAFVVNHETGSYFFDCPFNDELDEYPDEFTVYKLHEKVPLENALFWNELHKYGKRIGSIRIEGVIFDESKRKSILGDVLTPLLTK
jgi:hypothetical protein